MAGMAALVGNLASAATWTALLLIVAREVRACD